MFRIFELMAFEPVVVFWKCRGARVIWFSYVVLPRPERANHAD